MLHNKDVVATVAVRDLAAARKWYEGTLGLTPESTEGNEEVTYRTGSTRLMVYRSQYAGTNKATAATWVVEGDIDTLAKSLKDKGVPFERYNFPNTTLEGDVHVMGDMRVAWFKDPEGNVFALVNGRPSAVRS